MKFHKGDRVTLIDTKVHRMYFSEFGEVGIITQELSKCNCYCVIFPSNACSQVYYMSRLKRVEQLQLQFAFMSEQETIE